MATKAMARRTVTVRRSGASPKLAKLEKQLASTRANARRRQSKQQTRDQMATVLTGVAVGTANRLGLEVPYAGEIGTAGVVALASFVAGHYLKSDALKQAGATAAAIAIHELVEDSPMFDFMDRG